MYRNDYFMRLIEQMTEGMGTVLFRLRSKKQYDEVRQMLDDLLNKFGLPNRKLLLSLPPEEILRLVSVGSRPNLEQVYAAAFVLKEDAEMLAEEEDERAAAQAAKAMALYAVLSDASYDFAEPDEALQKLESIAAPRLTSELRYAMIGVYERAGQYAAAEDRLFAFAGFNLTASAQDELRHFGQAFYERLLQADEPALEQGGLPKEEVEEGLDAWRLLWKKRELQA